MFLKSMKHLRYFQNSKHGKRSFGINFKNWIKINGIINIPLPHFCKNPNKEINIFVLLYWSFPCDLSLVFRIEIKLGSAYVTMLNGTQM